MSTKAWVYAGLTALVIIALMVVALLGPQHDGGPWTPALTALGAVSLGMLMTERSR